MADLFPNYPDPLPDFQYLGGEQGRGQLESALAQPQQTFDRQYLYRTIFDKAAALMCSIIKNHPFVDGNKRMGLTAVAVFLSLNDYWFTPPPNVDEVVQTCVKIAQLPSDEARELAARFLRANATSLSRFRALSPAERRRRVKGAVYVKAAVGVMRNKLDRLEKVKRDAARRRHAGDAP